MLKSQPRRSWNNNLKNSHFLSGFIICQDPYHLPVSWCQMPHDNLLTFTLQKIKLKILISHLFLNSITLVNTKIPAAFPTCNSFSTNIQFPVLKSRMHTFLWRNLERRFFDPSAVERNTIQEGPGGHTAVSSPEHSIWYQHKPSLSLSEITSSWVVVKMHNEHFRRHFASNKQYYLILYLIYTTMRFAIFTQ